MKIKLLIFSFTISLFLIPHQGFASNQIKEVLDNGLTVIVTEIPSSPIVAVYGLVKTGSATEGEYLGSGLAHFLEHMLFKGTKKYKIGEVSEKVQAVGGSINAATSFDYTMYTINVPYDKFDLGIDVLKEMLFEADLDKSETEKERIVIQNEMRLHNDNPTRQLSRQTFKNHYVVHPYRHPIIGYRNLFDQASHSDLVGFYKKHYVANNIVLSIAGNVNGEEVIEKVKALFHSYPRTIYQDRNLPLEHDKITSKQKIIYFPTELPRLSIAYQSVRLLDEDLFALDVLASILGSGESSRLYRELYTNKGLVNDINAGNFTPIDVGVFDIDTTLKTEDYKSVISQIKKQIDLIKSEGVTTSELEKVKRRMKARKLYKSQKAGYVASSVAMDEAFTGDHTFDDKYIDSMMKVSADDVKRVAKKYLNHDVASIVVMLPKAVEKAQARTSKEKESQEIRREVLNNGITVLLKQDPTFSTVSIRLSLRGGLREEDESLLGISKLMTSVWVKGTKTKTAKQIEDLTESRAISLWPLSGKNSIGLNLDILADDLITSFDLLEDLVKNATFPQSEIDKNKEDMQIALKMRKENIFQFANYHLKQELFKKHSYRHDVNGTLETLSSIDQNQILSYYNRLVVPSNMVITVMGDIKNEKVLKLIKKRFENIKPKNFENRSFDQEQIMQPSTKTIELDKEQAIVLFGFHGVGLHNNERFNIEVLSAILGSSFNGRLFVNIREKLGKAYSLGGWSIPGIDTGVIQFYVLTSEQNVDEVIKLVHADIKDLQKKEIDQKELEEIKTYLIGNHYADLETISSLASTVGLDELYGLGYNYYQKYEENISSVTSNEIRQAAINYLNLNKSVTLIVKPQERQN